MDWAERLRQIGDEKEFQLRYKLSRRLFSRVCDAIRPYVEAHDEKQANRGSGGLISAELRLSMALRYFAGGHYIDIADLHGVAAQHCAQVSEVGGDSHQQMLRQRDALTSP